MAAAAASSDRVDATSAVSAGRRYELGCPLPAELGRCVLIHGFLSRAECAGLIADAERRGFVGAGSDYPPSYRNNDRQVHDDPELAGRLLARLRALGPEAIEDHAADRDLSEWRLHGINERIRWCRYGPDQRFNIHQDGVHHRGPECRSRLTFMIYLSGPEAFEGGDTLFFGAGPQADGDHGAPPVIARVQPRAGTLILFDHHVWHAGDTVTRGVKHVLRSDLIYRRAPTKSERGDKPFSPGHEGYVWTLARLSDGSIASGGRDGRIRLWSEEGRSLGALDGHRRSVLGLSEIVPGVLASVSRDRSLRLWNLATRECIRVIDAHSAAVLSIAKVSTHRFATAAADARIALWRSDGRALGGLTGHAGWVWSLASLGGDTLASASEDGSVKLWDTDRAMCLATIPGRHPLRSIDARTDTTIGGPRVLAAADAAGWVRLWSIGHDRIELVAQWKAHDAAVRRVRFLGRCGLATCGEDQRLRVWDTRDSSLAFESRHENFVTDVVEWGAGKLLSCGYDGALTVW